MFKKFAIMTPIMALSLSACMIKDPSVGTGPIELSSRVQRGFDNYQTERSPGHFAVAVDGSTYAYNYCSAGRCRSGSKPSAIHRCEERSDGVPCKIYGAKGAVVWDEESESDS
jgi:hypothetical protein